MRDLTCTGFRAALYVTGAWMFITLWSGSATAGERGLAAGATLAGALAVPVLAAWMLAWLLPERADTGPRRAGVRGDGRLTGTGRGVPRALALMVALMGVLVAAGEIAMIHLASLRALVPLDRPVPIDPRTVSALTDGHRLAALIEIGVFTAFALTFLVAAGLLRQELERRGGRGFRWTWRWTAVTLFLPVVNLVRPWLGLAEIDRAVSVSVRDGRVGDAWRRAGRLSLPTLLVAAAWFARLALETSSAQAGPAGTSPITDAAAWHATVQAMIDGAGTRLAMDLAVMAIMVWWVWRLHARMQQV